MACANARRPASDGGGASVDLMTDERDEGLDGLRDWEVLKPVC